MQSSKCEGKGRVQDVGCVQMKKVGWGSDGSNDSCAFRPSEITNYSRKVQKYKAREKNTRWGKKRSLETLSVLKEQLSLK